MAETTVSSTDFSAVYQHLPMPVAVFDSSLTYVDVNVAFERTFELNAEQVIGRRHVLSYVHENRASRVAQHERIARMLEVQPNEPVEYSRRTVTRSGKSLDVTVTVTRFVSAGEVHFVASYSRVQESSQDDQQLLSRLDIFRLTIEHSPVPTTVQDSEYRIILANKAACDFLGRTPDQLYGKDPQTWHIRSSEEQFRKARRNALTAVEEGKKIVRFTDERVAIHGVTGEQIPYRLEALGMAGLNGEQMWCAMQFDLRPTQTLEQRLRAQVLWLERGFDYAPVGMMAVRPDGTLLRSNNTLEAMTGLSDRDELEQLASKLRATMPLSVSHQSEQSLEGTCRLEFVRPGGEPQWLDCYSKTLTSAENEQINLLVINDATREHLLKSELRSALLQQSALLRSMDAGLMHVVGEIVVQVNPALENLLGKPERQLLGQPLEAIFADMFCWAEVEVTASKAIGDSGMYRFTERIIHANGSTRQCEIAMREVNAEREELGVLVTLTDVSDLLEQSEHLRESIAEIRERNDVATVGVAVLERGVVVRANPALLGLLDRSESDVQGTLFASYCDATAELGLNALLEGGNHEGGECVLRVNLVRNDLSLADCLLHVTPSSDDAPKSVTVVCVDLRQRNAALSLAVRMHMRFDAFAASLNEAVLVLSPTGNRIIHANHASQAIFGLAPDELIRLSGMRLWHGVADESADDLEIALAKLAAGEPSLSVLKMRHPGGQDMTVRLRMFGGGAGRGECFILAEDISRERELEQNRLEEAVGQRETLVREVHHRIKNNLQGVAGLLQQTAIRQPDLKETLSEVAGQIHAIAQVHGLQFRSDQALKAGEIVLAIADNLRINFGQRLDCEVVPGIDAVWDVPESEAVPLALVINELMTNAFKHSADDVSVQVSVDGDESGVMIRVVNKGTLPKGFDLENLPLTSSGLGLVKALIPRRGTKLSFKQQHLHVVVTLGLTAPALRVVSDHSDLA